MFRFIHQERSIHTRQTMKTTNPTNPKWPMTIKRGGSAVKIYRAKHRKSHVYQTIHWLGGKQMRRTFAAFNDAKVHAEEQAALLHAGQYNIAQMHSDDRHTFNAAVRLLAPLDVPLLDAVREYVATAKALPTGASMLAAAKDYARRHPENTPTKTVNEVIAELLAAKKQDKARPRYRKDLHGTLAANTPGSTDNRRNSFGNAFGTTRINTVTTADMDAWLRGRGVAPRTRTKLVTVLRTLFNFAKAAGYLPKGIATEADGLTTPKVQGAENIAIFSPEEMQKLITGTKAHTATDEHKLWLALGGFAGLRSAELARLEWGRHVQIERGLIQVSGDIAKTNGRRIITMQANLAAWLAPYAGRTGKVFTPRADERCHEYAHRLGVEWKANGLRHSFISYQCATTKNIPAVAMEAGNSVAIINKHYRELTTEAEGKAWFAIMPHAPANVIRMKKGAA